MEVLVVEDNPVSRELLCDMVQRLGYRVSGLGDGAEAVERLAARPADIVLLDCQMPGMDGYAVAARLREQYPDGTPVIIAVTADVSEDARERCRDAGMDGYLSKPVLIVDLAVMLEQWVAKIRKTPLEREFADSLAPDDLRRRSVS